MEKTVHYEKTLTSEVLFEGRVITLTKDTALLENGKTAEREVVHLSLIHISEPTRH